MKIKFHKHSRDIDEDGLPRREGKDLIKNFGKEEEIEVYNYPKKGLCCFVYDYNPMGVEKSVGGDSDCHVPVRCCTGLKFIKRIGDLDLNEH